MTSSTAAQFAPPLHHYCAYGVSIHSDVPLPLPRVQQPMLFELEIRSSKEPISRSVRSIKLEENLPSVFDVGSLSDGSHYVGLRGVGEILVAGDGRSILCYRVPQSNSESFNVYLLTQALSFCFVKNGFEPLHATAVVIAGRATVFLGDCGFGKSTLAAAFLQAGHRLLTDDLLLLRTTKRGILAYPGAARIKLFPQMASSFLGKTASGVPMNPKTQKLIVPLDDNGTCADAVPLSVIYALAPPGHETGNDIHIGSISKKRTFVTLLGSAFNCIIVDLDRLRRQFEAAQALANITIMRELSYPRSVECLPLVREAILTDLCAEKTNLPLCEA